MLDGNSSTAPGTFYRPFIGRLIVVCSGLISVYLSYNYLFHTQLALSMLSFLQISFQRDRDTGMTTVKYTIEKRTNLNINGAPCVLLNVKLDCNTEETPWCDNPDS